MAELDLRGGVPELSPSTLFGAEKPVSEVDLVRAIGALAKSPGTKGVFVRLGSAHLGLAAASEVGRLLGKLRVDGKHVVCHADGYDNGSIYFAALACDEVWLSPAGGVDSVGIAAQLVYGRELLEKLKVDVDFLQVGKYKGAEEPFTRDGPSDEAKASLEGALGGLRASWLEGIVKGRGSPEVGEAAEDGPFAAEEAKRRGLIDSVGDAEAALEALTKATNTTKTVVRFGRGTAPDAAPASDELMDWVRQVAGASAEGGPHIAVVRAVGGITMDQSGGAPFGGSGGISERALGRVIDDLASDARVKAVVVRIDSPGGSALASDLLWIKLKALRDKKPLVFSVGSMAASGGYYLASAGTKIFAEPVSIVGSIGVVGGKLSFERALEVVGVHAVTIAAAPEGEGKAARAAYGSPFEAWDDATRARVLASMTSTYDLFLDRVSEGRGISRDDVARSAEGRIFGGEEAKSRKLVDAIGGVAEAIAEARTLAGLPDDAAVVIQRDTSSIFDLLGGDVAADARARTKLHAEARAVLQASLGGLVPDVGAFVQSASPLIGGERSLAALPFALRVR